MQLKILSGGAADGLVAALTPQITAATGATLQGDYGAVGGMRERILAGEAVDVIILTRAIVGELAAGGHADPATVADLGAVATGVAVPEGAPAADVSTGAALAAMLGAAEAVFVPDMERSTAGRHVAGVLAGLDLAETLAGRLNVFPNGQTAMAAMAASGIAGAVGITQVTEILNTAGVRSCGALPDPFGLSTIYTAAVGGASEAPAAAAAMVSLLADPSNAAVRTATGFA